MKSNNEYISGTLNNSDTFAINFSYKKISWVYAYYNGTGKGKAEIYYGSNTGTSEYYSGGINSDHYTATCNQVFPSLNCESNYLRAATRPMNQALDKLNKLLAEANISIDDLKNSN